MKINGREITDECSHCGEILQCELFLCGHDIKHKGRSRITEMIACQIKHEQRRKNGYQD